MTVSEKAPASSPASKAKYHHGDLREALIAAAYERVNDAGADSFSLADACRLAGVSTAAPYRHFKDREEILAEVTARGFDTLTANAVRAVSEHGEGTLEGIIAMGRAYKDFAVAEQGVFRLMFGQGPSLEERPHVAERGDDCFGYLIQQIVKYCETTGMAQDPGAVATQLWTFVHGASSLLIDNKYAKITPGLDVDAMIEAATPQLLGARRSG